MFLLLLAQITHLAPSATSRNKSPGYNGRYGSLLVFHSPCTILGHTHSHEPTPQSKHCSTSRLSVSTSFLSSHHGPWPVGLKLHFSFIKKPCFCLLGNSSTDSEFLLPGHVDQICTTLFFFLGNLPLHAHSVKIAILTRKEDRADACMPPIQCWCLQRRPEVVINAKSGQNAICSDVGNRGLKRFSPVQDHRVASSKQIITKLLLPVHQKWHDEKNGQEQRAASPEQIMTKLLLPAPQQSL
eukprot:scaffold124315_cov19-Tisochrysis_lutea.AAC.1